MPDVSITDPATEMYRLSWEIVQLGSLWKYSNADPSFYKNTTQTVPNSQIPDDEWERITKLDSNPHSQYNKLKEWSDSEIGFVRNVTLVKVLVTEMVVDSNPHGSETGELDV
jgi:hypothetical protein